MYKAVFNSFFICNKMDKFVGYSILFVTYCYALTILKGEKCVIFCFTAWKLPFTGIKTLSESPDFPIRLRILWLLADELGPKMFGPRITIWHAQWKVWAIRQHCCLNGTDPLPLLLLGEYQLSKLGEKKKTPNPPSVPLPKNYGPAAAAVRSASLQWHFITWIRENPSVQFKMSCLSQL